MCGRYTITVTYEELLMHYYIDEDANSPWHKPRYNLGPAQMAPAVIAHEGENRIGEMKWGLIPAWAKDDKMAYSTFNARTETIMEKATFKIPFQRKRCLVPADSFYEWKKTGDSKQPMRILLRDKGIFSMAGIWDTWTNPDGVKIHS